MAFILLNSSRAYGYDGYSDTPIRKHGRTVTSQHSLFKPATKAATCQRVVSQLAYRCAMYQMKAA